MNKLLLSAAALSLLAFPALAQQPNGFDLTHGDRGQQRAAPAPQAAPAPAPAPAPQAQAAPQQRGRGGDRGGDRGGNRGDRGGNHTANQGGNPGGNQGARPPAQQGGFNPNNGFDLTHGMPNGAPAPQAQQNRGGDRGHDNNRGNDNRNGFNGGNRGDRGGYDNNNRGNYGRGYGNNGGRRDYSSFRNYHRSTNASRRFRGPAYRRPSGWYAHSWTFGDLLPSLFWSSNYWLNDYDDYDLPPPPYGTVWVRNNSDALLIDRDSGEIISIEYGVFY